MSGTRDKVSGQKSGRVGVDIFGDSSHISSIDSGSYSNSIFGKYWLQQAGDRKQGQAVETTHKKT